jgi:hypothetical protein
MRTRDEVTKRLKDNMSMSLTPHSATANNTEVIVELLLDIRELLKNN